MTAETIVVCRPLITEQRYLRQRRMNNKFHRSLEAHVTESLLKAIFNDEEKFSVHSALPQV
ncbi:N-succinylarginine dihydrolase, partial [Escherichia sp. TWPC-MK]